MGDYITLDERKAAKVAAIRKGMEELERKLSGYAREHGGRFILFGSAATGNLRFNSDVDILVDFPVENEAAARTYVEDECMRLGLPADIFSAGMVADRLRERAEREGRVYG